MVNMPSNGRTDFVIVERTLHQVIGKVGLWRLDPPELGFMLHPDHWGHGYAAEAIDAVLGNAWTLDGEYQIDHVTADADPRNTACLRLLEKLGFYKIGEAKNTFETHLGWCDSVYLILDRPESR